MPRPAKQEENETAPGRKMVSTGGCRKLSVQPAKVIATLSGEKQLLAELFGQFLGAVDVTQGVATRAGVHAHGAALGFTVDKVASE